MSTYLERFNLAQDADLRKRLQACLWELAVEKLAAGNAKEKDFAKKKLKGAADNDELFALVIRLVGDPTIGAKGNACTDSEMKTVVSSVFTDLAG